MADKLTIENGRILYAQREGGAAPWWAGMQRAGMILQPATWAPDASIEEIRAAAGLEWDAVSLPVEFTMPDGRRIISKEHAAIVRSDTGQILGTASAGYQVHTMQEIFETFRRLCDTQLGGGWKLDTCGALKNAQIVWAQAYRDEDAEIVPGDTLSHRLMLQTSFDGSQPTGCNDSETRIVCDNTRRMSWGNAKRQATQRHRSKLNGDKLIAKAGINTGSELWQANCEALRRLADITCTDGQARDLLAKILQGDKDSKTAKPAPVSQGADDLASLLGKPAALAADQAPATIGIGASVTREHRNVSPILALFQGQGQGSQLAGVKETRYGLLNAITEFVDHHQGRTWDTGRTAAMFGQGAALKAQAFEVLIADTPAAQAFA